MTMAVRRQMDELGVEECLALLDGRVLGRLAFAVEGRPRIVPLNYALHQGSVVFRTGYGDLLDAVHRQDVVFEVDDTDPETHTGWSVIVQGVAEEIWRPEEIEIVRHLPLRPWAPGTRDHYVRILSSAITGRRIR
ncbi:MAG TPA: pyridoxamine 5'-phosphate oxidase family protein [Euzebyales bacterium]|nr:pyridoxamine 5'-phosphate oxidase family protein [Euzebyales bacterium]